jgi:hypothetical protein
MKARFIFACVSLALIAPSAQAGTLSIDDLSEGLALYVNAFNMSTNPGDFPPGSGAQIDITTPTPSNGISAIVYNAPLETLSFTFANQSPWPSDVYFYAFINGTEGGPPGTLQPSDLFVIQGQGGQNPDYITFISDPGPVSGDVTSIVPVLFPNAVPTDVGPLTETGAYQLVFNTGPDQYYFRSDVPEPSALALFGAGIATMACLSLRARKNKRD